MLVFSKLVRKLVLLSLLLLVGATAHGKTMLLIGIGSSSWGM